jgi:hypothetical protein
MSLNEIKVDSEAKELIELEFDVRTQLLGLGLLYPHQQVDGRAVKVVAESYLSHG